MKSIRLNDVIRAQIIANALNSIPELSNHDLKEKEEAFIKKWGDKVYNRLYPTSVRRRMKNMPQGAFAEVTHLNFYLDVENGKINNEHVVVRFGEARPVFADHVDHWKDNDELPEGIDAQELYEDHQLTDRCAIDMRRRSKRREMLQFLKQFNTTKQLAEAWPEGAKFIPKAQAEPGMALIIRPDSINKMLGLNA